MDNFVIEKREFNQQELLNVKSKYINQYPIIYMLYNNTKRPQVYIGQTIQMNIRMRDHLKKPKRKKLSNVLLISHGQFNQTTTYNLETNLINNFIGDEKFKLQNISQTRRVQMHVYYQKPYYDEELFRELWDELYDMILLIIHYMSFKIKTFIICHLILN